MELTGRIAAVTGAGGTVGRAVVRRLAAEGMSVRALVRHTPPPPVPGVEVVTADLEDAAALERALAGAAVVVHCAAAMTDDPDVCRAGNIDGVRNLVAGFAAARCERLVHVSTVSAYDFTRGSVFDEDAALLTEPLAWYGYSKAESERIIGAAGIPAVILRPVMVLSMEPNSYWGPLARERARRAPERIVRRTSIPYVHVENFADAIVLAARTDAALGRAYNAIDGTGDTEAYLTALYGSIGTPVPPPPTELLESTYPGDRIRRELGYAPTDRFDEFLAQLARA